SRPKLTTRAAVGSERSVTLDGRWSGFASRARATRVSIGSRAAPGGTCTVRRSFSSQSVICGSKASSTPVRDMKPITRPALTPTSRCSQKTTERPGTAALVAAARNRLPRRAARHRLVGRRAGGRLLHGLAHLGHLLLSRILRLAVGRRFLEGLERAGQVVQA